MWGKRVIRGVPQRIGAVCRAHRVRRAARSSVIWLPIIQQYTEHCIAHRLAPLPSSSHFLFVHVSSTLSLVLRSRSSLSYSPFLRVVPADAGRVENEMRRELACNEDIQDVIMDLQQKHGHLAEVLQRVLKMAQM